MNSWENNIRKVVPYVPGEQPKNQDVIKLNTNENPYPPSPEVERVLRTVDPNLLRKYPDPTASKLVEAIADVYGVNPGQVFVGVGSDDVLAMSFMTFFNSDKPILFPDITYSFYDVWADLLKIPYQRIPLTEDFKIDANDYAIPNGGVVFPNPNAPTGELLKLEDVERIISANQDVIVIVDEAYIDFGGISALPLLAKYDNLLVVQTFSKSRSLAGSRIGYAIGSEKLISYLNDVKYSFNSYTMDQVTIEAGTAAVKDVEYLKETSSHIVRTREWTKQELSKLGFVFGDSKSNFLFVTHPRVAAEKLFEELKAAQIYVRYFKSPARISNYLRITIGTGEEMYRLVEFLKEYIIYEPSVRD